MLVLRLAGVPKLWLLTPKPKVALPVDLTEPPTHALQPVQSKLAVQCVAFTDEVFWTVTTLPLYAIGGWYSLQLKSVFG